DSNTKINVASTSYYSGHNRLSAHHQRTLYTRKKGAQQQVFIISVIYSHERSKVIPKDTIYCGRYDTSKRSKKTRRSKSKQTKKTIISFVNSTAEKEENHMKMTIE
uniref:Uncharacterized protein n=1 Tax=Clytia hemisphaerica TaxID=252671 RepID=A0A7M5VE06_9CNID